MILAIDIGNTNIVLGCVDDNKTYFIERLSTIKTKMELEKTDDILKYLGEHRKDGQFLCGFSMETENMVENSRKKLEKKKLDMIAANNLKVAGAGFQGDTNQMTLITKEDETALPMISKEETAACILDKILECMNK